MHKLGRRTQRKRLQKAPVDRSVWLCWSCGKPGNIGRDWPQKKAPLRTVTETAVAGIPTFFGHVGDEDCDVVVYRPCPHPSEWDVPPVVMDVDWGPLAKERYRRRTTAVFGL